jgi:hypothetical protein
MSSHRFRNRRVAWAPAVATVIVGCSDILGFSRGDEKCTRDSDCSQGNVCAQGQCRGAPEDARGGSTGGVGSGFGGASVGGAGRGGDSGGRGGHGGLSPEAGTGGEPPQGGTVGKGGAAGRGGATGAGAAGKGGAAGAGVAGTGGGGSPPTGALNLVFMTSETFPTTLGSAEAYDEKCNQVATRAGLNDESGDAFVALVSDSNSLAIERLAGARGWVRMDGQPFADTLESLQMDKIFNTIRFDENGADVGGDFEQSLALTGVDPALGLSDNCSNWTSSSLADLVTAGFAEGGPNSWAAGHGTYCNSVLGLICMGKSKNAPLLPIAVAGLKIWVSDWGFPAATPQDPDTACQAARPNGVDAAAALIARTDASAAEVLDPQANYVRPDGTFVGTGAQLAQGIRLASGIWQTADGSYVDGVAWTGSAYPDQPGTISGTCSNWTSQTGGPALMGDITYTTFWWGQPGLDCDAGLRLYCVEIPPPR